MAYPDLGPSESGPREFLRYLRSQWPLFVVNAVALLLLSAFYLQDGLPLILYVPAICFFTGYPLWQILSGWYRGDDPEEEAGLRRAHLAWDEDEEPEEEIRFPLEPPEGDARSMLLPAIEQAPSPALPASFVIGPGLWALCAWLVFLALVPLSLVWLQRMQHTPHFLPQAAFIVPLDLLTVVTVLIWTLPRRVEADATGIRVVVAGIPGKVLSWDQVKMIRYGVCGLRGYTRYSQHDYRAAGFIEIQARRRWRTIYADDVYYSVNTKTLARFTQYVLHEAARHGVRTDYMSVEVRPSEL